MKSVFSLASNVMMSSHPSRGAWIEIDITRLLADKRKGRTPHGVRGLK